MRPYLEAQLAGILGLEIVDGSAVRTAGSFLLQRRRHHRRSGGRTHRRRQRRGCVHHASIKRLVRTFPSACETITRTFFLCFLHTISTLQVIHYFGWGESTRSTVRVVGCYAVNMVGSYSTAKSRATYYVYQDADVHQTRAHINGSMERMMVHKINAESIFGFKADADSLHGEYINRRDTCC